MRAASKVVAIILAEIEAALRPGLTTLDIDRLAEQTLARFGATSPFKDYPNLHDPTRPFPGYVCTSVNDELVHGVPDAAVVLEDGDIVTVDCGARLDGWVGDSAWTFAVGQVSAETQKLLDVTKRALYDCISAARAGNRTGDIAAKIQQSVESRGYNVVREYTSHGIGRELHEDPFIFNHGKPGRGKRLRAGMTLALEPMVLAGDTDTFVDEHNAWTVRSFDGGLTAHFEHTVVVTDGEPEILTQL